MLPLLHSELFRLARRWMPRVLLAILFAIVGVLYLLFWTVMQTGSETSSDIQDLRENLRLAAVRDTGLSLVFQVGAVDVIILTSSLIGAEFGWGTIRTLLPRARSREALLAAKTVTALLFVVVTVVTGTVVAFGASAFVTAVEDLPRGLGPDGVVRTLAAIGRTIYAMVPYAALALMITTWTRSVAAGIGVGLSVLFLEGLILSILGAAGDVFDRVPGALISRNVQTLLNANGAGLDQRFSGGDGDLPPQWRAALVLGLYSAVFVAIAFQRFRSRDITAGGG
ncbi:MAG: type transport system permease protein [Thermomicrobiales bacterium]|jgi:ABC-2 type transport system permease protein|nr:type transport system permease protein [Thermomicrobiales bacterium]